MAFMRIFQHLNLYNKAQMSVSVYNIKKLEIMQKTVKDRPIQ